MNDPKGGEVHPLRTPKTWHHYANMQVIIIDVDV